MSPDVNGPEDRLRLANARASVPWQPVIEKILTHLGLQARAPPRAPTRGQALQAEPGHKQSGGLFVCLARGRATGPTRPARGLTLPNRDRSDDLATGVAGVGCVREFAGPMEAAK